VDSAPGEATLLLERLRAGDRAAADRLYTLLYDDLRRIAERLFRRRKSANSLGATALVHEAYLKLAGADHEAAWKDSAHALAVAARAMRQVLANHARDRAALKRGGGRAIGRLSVDGIVGDEEGRPVDAASLHEAFARLEALDPRQGDIAQWKLLGGLSTEQIASLLGVTTRTVELDWRMAKRVLARALTGTGTGGSPSGERTKRRG
jgi:RNA polymerase sigma factor (TIGR02999 family)